MMGPDVEALGGRPCGENAAASGPAEPWRQITGPGCRTRCKRNASIDRPSPPRPWPGWRKLAAWELIRGQGLTPVPGESLCPANPSPYRALASYGPLRRASFLEPDAMRRA